MNKVAVIVAGGSGKRMGNELPKQFMMIDQKPVLFYTLNTFLSAYPDMQIILVLAEEFLGMGNEIIDAFFEKDRIKIAIGGATRFESVKNGLSLIEEDAIVFVHDAARCTLTTALIHRCYDTAVATGTAIPVMECSDSIRMIAEDGSNEAIDRDKIKMVQTPQVFHSKILLPAFNIDYKNYFTDEASVVEAFGMMVTLVKGEKENLKITHPVDLLTAAAILQSRAASESASGEA
ncbi:2-C-methyl-D-erythritol 4-phosphate cytidylyltransferase [Niabella insulamsoli]|uniref:2-C-methyl-D-erythritol 4-phosphate cytidylyltransferase n=1 Tax=Niabella insulamsoli TaxID=3144874 RepID=UPI0031FE0082